jgi:hypothetical protein
VWKELNELEEKESEVKSKMNFAFSFDKFAN